MRVDNVISCKCSQETPSGVVARWTQSCTCGSIGSIVVYNISRLDSTRNVHAEQEALAV